MRTPHNEAGSVIMMMICGHFHRPFKIDFTSQKQHDRAFMIDSNYEPFLINHHTRWNETNANKINRKLQ